MVKIPTPPDPRKLLPRNADPEHRGKRKELEKKHGYGYKEPIILGLIGIGLIWNIENQVSKHEERKDEEERKQKEREERRRGQREDGRSGTRQPGDDRSNRGSMSRYDDRDQGRRSADESRRGDYRDGSRHRDYREEPRRLDYRDYEYRGYRDQYNDYRNDTRYTDRRDGSVRRSSRRDSF